MNLKVWDTRRARSAEIFLVVPLHTFLGLKVKFVVIVKAFVMVSTVWSVFCCCSSTHGVPSAQLAIRKSGGS